MNVENIFYAILNFTDIFKEVLVIATDKLDANNVIEEYYEDASIYAIDNVKNILMDFKIIEEELSNENLKMTTEFLKTIINKNLINIYNGNLPILISEKIDF